MGICRYPGKESAAIQPGREKGGRRVVLSSSLFCFSPERRRRRERRKRVCAVRSIASVSSLYARRVFKVENVPLCGDFPEGEAFNCVKKVPWRNNRLSRREISPQKNPMMDDRSLLHPRWH